jgi:hypothetical protein
MEPASLSHLVGMNIPSCLTYFENLPLHAFLTYYMEGIAGTPPQYVGIARVEPSTAGNTKAYSEEALSY